MRAGAAIVVATMIATGSVGSVAVSGGLAQERDPLLAAPGGDPLELARVVDRIGDRAVLDRLAADRPADVRLAALRAAPAMRAPESALGALAEIAGGRDPDLAPAAMLSVLTIARALDPLELDAREVLRADLAPARRAIGAIAADATARADLRRGAELAVDALAALGVPAT
jgi:hypothetical protein